MAQVFIQTITRFNGGISDDPRQPSPTQFAVARHFDIFTYPEKLKPFRNFEADQTFDSSASGLKAYGITDFLKAGDGKIYAIGNKLNDTGSKIFYKSSETGLSWTSSSTAETVSSVHAGSFSHIPRQGNIYFFAGTNYLMNVTVNTGGAIPDSQVFTTSDVITSVAKGITAKNANHYTAYNNWVVNASDTIEGEVLELPDEYNITSLENYGNYLAIACEPVGDVGESKVFLWDLVSDDVTEQINWGAGHLKVIANVDGRLIGVTDEYISKDSGNDRGRMVIRAYQGGEPVVIKEVESMAKVSNAIRSYREVRGGKFYFYAKIAIDTAGSSFNEGIWAFGRKTSSDSYALTVDTIVQEVTTGGIQGFADIGSFRYVSHSGNGSIFRTSDTETYTYTSSYESQIYGDPSRNNQLLAVALSYEPLISGASITLKYRVNQETTWTTIMTDNILNSMSKIGTIEVPTQRNFKAFREIQFRIESTGGATPTQLKFKYIQDDADI